MTRTGSVIASIAVMIITAAQIGRASEEWPITAPLQEREKRLEEASPLLNGFLKLRQELPTLSPSEKQWVERESAEALGESGTINRRYLNLLDTKEFALYYAEPRVLRALSALNSIQSSDVSNEEETFDWSCLVEVLIDRQLWQHLDDLSRKGVLARSSLQFVGSADFQEVLIGMQSCVQN